VIRWDHSHPVGAVVNERSFVLAEIPAWYRKMKAAENNGPEPGKSLDRWFRKCGTGLDDRVCRS
jgi:hypothetical protein